jgi:hypothetical protein
MTLWSELAADAPGRRRLARAAAQKLFACQGRGDGQRRSFTRTFRNET